jgi:hypothetical protein
MEQDEFEIDDEVFIFCDNCLLQFDLGDTPKSENGDCEAVRHHRV